MKTFRTVGALLAGRNRGKLLKVAMEHSRVATDDEPWLPSWLRLEQHLGAAVLAGLFAVPVSLSLQLLLCRLVLSLL